MNYILILLEVIFTFFLMFIFYKVGKKNGLYLYMVLMSSIASIIMFKTIDLFSFQVNLGIPIIMGLFICNNIIIQRFGIDEVKRIMTTSGIAYVVVGINVSLQSLTINSDYVLTSNEVFNSLFGYDINNIRIFIGGFVSIMLMLWSSSYVYYYIRRSKNILWFSNIGTMLFIQMLESIIFVITFDKLLFKSDTLWALSRKASSTTCPSPTTTSGGASSAPRRGTRTFRPAAPIP